MYVLHKKKTSKKSNNSRVNHINVYIHSVMPTNKYNTNFNNSLIIVHINMNKKKTTQTIATIIWQSIKNKKKTNHEHEVQQEW